MASKLMTQECSESCRDQFEFSLRFIVQKLLLTDKEKNRGFEDISLIFTLDSNIIKIEKIQSPDENVDIQKQVFFNTSPEQFARKLKKSPIMINLVRECADLGTVKLEITDCFSDAVLCEEFSSEKMVCDYTFVKDGTENGSMELSVEVVRSPVNSEAMKDFLRSNAKRLARKKNQSRSVVEEYDSSLSSNDGLSSFMCDADLLKHLCPLEENTNRTSSTKSKHSKCLSDIAASLDVNKFSENQKTYCRGCRGFSISGVTCENKELLTKRDLKRLPKSRSCSRKPSQIDNTLKQKCSRPVNRICSECFADLTILSKEVPCPNCCCLKKIAEIEERGQRKKKKEIHTDSSNNYFGRMLKAILHDGKTNLEEDFGKKVDANMKCKTIKNNKKKKNGKGRKKLTTLPRCCKVKKANETSKNRNKGLRIKHYGVVLGHKDCKCESMLVPKNMGWLWNVETLGISKIRRGWKPGAVPKTVARTMKFFLTKECEPPAEGRCMNEKHKSTLKVEKKLGEYTITLNPLSDKCGNSPITFKISKTEDEKKRWNARQLLKRRGITKQCDCNEISECHCINECQKQKILCELKAISKVMCICPEMKYEELNDASECSEIDFEFTPPIEMVNKCKRDVRVSVAATQYEEPTSEKFEETEESEHEIVVKKIKKAKKNTKKNAKKNVNDDKKKIQKSSGLLLKSPPNLCEIPSNKCISYCKTNFVQPPCYDIQPQCEFGDRSTTNYNPLYQRCLPNYSSCPSRPVCCHSHNYFDSFNY